MWNKEHILDNKLKGVTVGWPERKSWEHIQQT